MSFTHRLHQGLSIEDAAKRWKVQPSTVATYLADAILSGHGYHWPACNITEEEMSLLQNLAVQLIKDKGEVFLPCLIS